MNLQLALDRLTRDECFQLLKETEPYVDWIEIGTGVIKEYGMEIVREVKECYREKVIVADMKTCDAGTHEAIQAFEAGADITTVMAFSADQTILDTLEVAKRYNKQIMIDLLGVTNQNRLIELQRLGVNLVSLHFGKDMQKQGELGAEQLAFTTGFPDVKVAVAGGINVTSLPRVLKTNPHTVIVGSAITKADNPKQTAAHMKGLFN
ncbi:3-hexulose-6-phosphate synthase [Metabacillus iocasae]|uniref:3-hexulose-6-phosphate synthase n=1 Tax=Priestia iocasae TaxID=2291674 RepID=A0ABS2QY88_9BACI|nr:3-hexulose-6-phosphate synthase [Metabacillus iocasae]MBM7704387.1 3-hexulose-6-phosphate synthase [Metabacillus iocasae]